MILGFDTSGAHVGTAIFDGTDVPAAHYIDMRKGQAERLMPMIEETLADAKISLSDLTAIGVGIGPGNFTGIRISVSAARGLALALGIPAIGVSLLDALALKAAVATSKLEGRLAREADIRDAYHLTPPDADGMRHWGPDGDVLAFWRNAVRMRLVGPDWKGSVAILIDDNIADAVEGWLTTAMEQAKSQGPLMAATDSLRTVLEADDRVRLSMITYTFPE